MVPPPGDWRVEVERERKVAGEVFFKKGQTPLDWCRRASMMRLEVSTERTSKRGRSRGSRGGEGMWVRNLREVPTVGVRRVYSD